MDLRKYLVKNRIHVYNSSEESDSEKHEGESSLADDIVVALPPAKRKMLCSDVTLVQLMIIAIEGPDQTAVSFDETLDVIKNNHRIQL